MKNKCPMFSLLLVGTVLTVFGCDVSQQPEPILQVTSNSFTDRQASPVETFIFMAPVERKTVKHQIENLMLTGLPGGSLVHLIKCPDHRVIASVSVPYGSAKSRLKNRQFQNEYAAMIEYFEKRKEPSELDQLALPAIAESVTNLRRTDLKCRVVLCGSPIFDDPKQSTFTMAMGLFPSDGLIGHPHSPWILEPTLPSGTQVSWLTSGTRWGASSTHRKQTARFNRLYIKELGGHVVRITPDPTLAFSFAKPYLKNDISRLDEEPAMIDPNIDPQLDQREEDLQPHIIKVKKPRVSFSKAGSFKYRVEMAGGDPAALAGEAIVLRVGYDGSGSMAAHIQACNETILKIAESLPELVKSLEIGITVHRDQAVDFFPISKIRDASIDGGASYKNLANFVSQIQARGEDAAMQDMLRSGMTELAKAGKGKRQFLMTVGDYVNFGVAGKSNFDSVATSEIAKLRSWCNQTGTDRRIIAMYRGGAGPMENFFRDLGTSNPKSLYSNNPQDLIDALLSAAIPNGTPTR